MQMFALDGINVQIPDDWYGRLYVDEGPAVGDATAYPTGHFATFALPAISITGSFGSGATAVMGSSDIFVALLEYVADQYLQPGVGRFRDQGFPTGIVPSAFAPNALQVARTNQVGFQRFFTVKGRAFCLFVVMGDAAFAAPHLSTLTSIVQGISIAPRPVVANAP